MANARPLPRSDDDDTSPTYLGIGSVHAVSEERPEPPGIWLPMHRSGSRFGGWRKQSVEPPTRPIGFRAR